MIYLISSIAGRKDGIAMQNEKHFEASVFIYMGLLLLLVVGNIINSINLIDLIYLVVVVCCALRFYMIVNNGRN